MRCHDAGVTGRIDGTRYEKYVREGAVQEGVGRRDTPTNETESLKINN